ncbi:hypothetical protein MCOR25_007235 [Pyricularia grisea]|nr:hypothetical protein MCOR25_007235 [Pyricularia grisea]
MSSRPQSRAAFQIAIACAVTLEYDAATLLFDAFHDEDGDPYGRAPGDYNRYTTGRIGSLDVVLALASGMGRRAMADLAAGLRASYTGLHLVVLTGICAGIPADGREMLLGDVVISRTLVQYDFGRRLPFEFETKESIAHGPHASIRAMVEAYTTNHERDKLLNRALVLLAELQAKGAKRRRPVDYSRPPAATDVLFDAAYLHRHAAGCDGCSETQICNVAAAASCEELGCDSTRAIVRPRLAALDVDMFVGRIGCGDKVMRSGKHRDRLAAEYGVIALEMEGVGAWDSLPCVVVKSVCDYADSHKNKRWQLYAAATAAATTKAMLAGWVRVDSVMIGDAGKGHNGVDGKSEGEVHNRGAGGVSVGSITARNVLNGGTYSGDNQTFTFN